MANRVTIVSQPFYPETAATAQLFTELAVDLTGRGLEVRAYAAQPSYHRRQKLPKRETHQGVRIERLWATQFGRERLLGRLLDGGTFSLSVFLRLLLSRQRPGEVLLVTTNPPILGWVAWLARLLRKRRYMLVIHDLYPDVAEKLGYMRANGLLARMWRSANRRAYRRSSGIVVLGESMRDTVLKAYGPLPHVHVIHSWADGSAIQPLPKGENPLARAWGLDGPFVVLYSGNLGQAHQLDVLVKAAERLQDILEVVIVFIGEGAKKAELVFMVQELGLRNVLFFPPVPYGELRHSLGLGDIGVVTLERGVEGLCEPSKLYGYLAAGLAILALVGERCEVAEIVKKHRCGYRLDHDDAAGVVRVVRHLAGHRAELEEMKRSARECLERFYDRRVAVEKYLDVIRNL